jgi:dipeptidyl aminopeptidase/acylaminoacyl peptidase
MILQNHLAAVAPLARARRFLGVFGAVAMLCPMAFASPALGEARRFSADDLPRIVRIADPKISPDGKTVAIVVSRANMKDDRYDGELALVDVATKQLRVVTHGRLGVASPRWSPSGDRIAFLAEDADKKTQVYMLPLSGGDAMPLTRSKTAVTLFAWRPDGAGLAYAAADEEPEKKDEAKFEDAFEVGNNSYLERARPQPTHLWTLDLASGAAKRLTQGAWSLPRTMAPSAPPSQILWAPDGRSIVFVRSDSPITGDNDTARLAVVDVASGAVRPLAAAGSAQTQPVLSPDGSRVAFVSARDGHRGFELAAYVAGLAGGGATDATHDIDHDLSVIGWTPDSRSLVVAGAEGTHSVIWVKAIGGGTTQLSLGGLNPTGAATVGASGALAFTATDATHPSELFYLPQPGAAPVQLTHLQTATEGVALGRQETVRWKNDKFEVDGVLTYPPNYTPGKKLPLVLYIHGGPVAASLETFSPTPHILASKGWLVLEPNYRGSNNHGNAFQTAIFGDASAGPGRDIMAGVSALIKRGIVDEKRMAVSGWSYGGQMTSWLIGAYPGAWRAAVAGAPVTDLVDQYTLADSNVLRATQYGPSPFIGDNMKAYAAQSSITQAWRVKAPTLIMSDVGDWRVTTTQAYKLYHALRDNKVPVSFIAYPVPGHSPADPIRSRDVFRRWTAWLSLYLAEPALSS